MQKEAQKRLEEKKGGHELPLHPQPGLREEGHEVRRGEGGGEEEDAEGGAEAPGGEEGPGEGEASQGDRGGEADCDAQEGGIEAVIEREKQDSKLPVSLAS